MNKLWQTIKSNYTYLTLYVLASTLVIFLMFYKLGSLVPGYSFNELNTATSVLGFTGFFAHILYLPIEIVRSILFAVFVNHGYAITRVPNVIFGIFTICIYTWIIYTWHGRRTAFFSFLIFSCSAWMLHISRIATNDIVYAVSAVALVAIFIIIKKYKDNANALIFSLLALSLILTVPGMIWLIAILLFTLKEELKVNWSVITSINKRILILLSSIYIIPVLIYSLLVHSGVVRFLGLPNSYDGVQQIIKHFIAVPIHLFIRGPQYPDIWLERAVILDIFVLITSALGILFYINHKEAARSKYLLITTLFSVLLVGLNGPVSIALVIPLLFIFSATGIAYLSREWLLTFPINPFARLLGISLLSIAVGLSCIYGLRSYFIAWPHNDITKNTFIYRKN